ncbi:molybdenum cofactor guanylyltransferase [Pseudidiomarina sp. CB1]|uniref:molybdenum cofactor guanylyltransferase n=1 Tax=Pseudidiomarina sp. CB1 TaxID=2972484 RepID=UPI00216173D1|nr:molybdenum cofactor guanylyltransferase [Pseudidiomarina sp. CB1]
MQLTGVIIAGGKSSRMGLDKALLEVAGMTQLERCQRLLREVGCAQIRVSRNAEGYIQDLLPNAGPLGGLLSVMHHLDAVPQRLVVVPIDMPLLTAAALQQLLNQPGAVYFNGSSLPCVVNYSQELVNYLTQQLCDDGGDRSVRSMLQAMNAQALAWPYSYQLHNTNTPQQWRRAIEMLGVSL